MDIHIMHTCTFKNVGKQLRKTLRSVFDFYTEEHTKENIYMYTQTHPHYEKNHLKTSCIDSMKNPLCGPIRNGPGLGIDVKFTHMLGHL